jgi:hypothetical protein
VEEKTSRAIRKKRGRDSFMQILPVYESPKRCNVSIIRDQ